MRPAGRSSRRARTFSRPLTLWAEMALRTLQKRAPRSRPGRASRRRGLPCCAPGPASCCAHSGKGTGGCIRELRPVAAGDQPSAPDAPHAAAPTARVSSRRRPGSRSPRHCRRARPRHHGAPAGRRRRPLVRTSTDGRADRSNSKRSVTAATSREGVSFLIPTRRLGGSGLENRRTRMNHDSTRKRRRTMKMGDALSARPHGAPIACMVPGMVNPKHPSQLEHQAHGW